MDTIGNNWEIPSSQLTFSPSFFRGVGLNHQPVDIHCQGIFGNDPFHH